MKKLLILCLFLPLFSQSQGIWSWVTGTTASTAFGTLGVPNPANTPGESYACTPWSHPSKDLYLYSGITSSASSVSNTQMWKFDAVTQQWLLVSGAVTTVPSYGTMGVPSPTNTPDAIPYGAAHWVDTNGDLWFMGGQLNCNNMWKYDVSTDQWTWMFGMGLVPLTTPVYGTLGVPAPGNSPSGYLGENCVNWVDNAGNFWLFREDDGVLWKFDPGILQWSWESGTPGAAVNYGTIGVAAATNTPGILNPIAFDGFVFRSWKDNNGGLYMGFSRNVLINPPFELWKYDLNTSLWTCLYNHTFTPPGPGLPIQPEFVAGCDPDTGNKPILGTEQRAMWSDDCGHGWMLLTSNISFGPAAGDLWRFDIDANLFVHVARYPSRVIGTMGVPSVNDHPAGTANGPSCWTNPDGFWLLEGSGSTNSILWKYNADTVIADFSFTTVCETVTFNNLSTTGCNAYKSIFWDFGDGNTSSQFDPVHTYASAGTYQVTLIVQNCTWDADTIVQSITTTNCSINGTLNTDTICAGGCGSLTASAAGGTPPYTFAWNNGIPNTNGGPVTVCPITSTTYAVTITDALSNIVTVQSQVVVEQPFDVDLGPDTTLCGSGYLLNAQLAGASYLWQNGSTNAQFFATQPGVYWVEVSRGVCSDRDSVVIDFYQSSASFSAANIAGCAPLTTQFTDLSASPVGNITQWVWDFGDGNTSTSANPTHTYTLPGNYTVSLTVRDGNGCSDDTLISQLIQVYPNPVALFEMPPVITGDLAEFLDLSTNASQWAWDFGDGFTSTDRNPTHIYGNEESYTITLNVVSPNGCVDSISYTLTLDLPFHLYIPNAFSPNSDGRNDAFTIYGSEIADFHLEIYDRWGKVIYESFDIGNSWDGSYGGEAVPEGVYVWKMEVRANGEDKTVVRGGSVMVLR